MKGSLKKGDWIAHTMDWSADTVSPVNTANSGPQNIGRSNWVTVPMENYQIAELKG